MRILTATVIHGVYNVMIVLPGISTIAAVLIALTALATSVIFIKDGWRLEQSAVTNGEEKPYTPNT
jgi:pilus assembly protein TadC